MLWAAEGKSRHEWDHTATINYFVVNSQSTKKVPLHKFHPFMKESKPDGIPWNSRTHKALTDYFTNGISTRK